MDHVDIVQHIPIQSSAKNFAFSLAGTQTLVIRSSVTGDKVFFVATQAREQGPNVVLYSNFSGDSIKPHQRWGTGFLVDNVSVHGGAINFINRGTMGSGHGWAMGWGVVWNSTADALSIQAPPGAINWAIGSSGQRVGKPMPISGAGSKGRPALPEASSNLPTTASSPTASTFSNCRIGSARRHFTTLATSAGCWFLIVSLEFSVISSELSVPRKSLTCHSSQPATGKQAHDPPFTILYALLSIPALLPCLCVTLNLDATARLHPGRRT